MPEAHHYYIIYKPYGIVSKFTPQHGHKTLADIYSFPPDVYPVGRLDMDSEGLLLLTDDKRLNHQLLNPHKRHERVYWVQVDGDITDAAIQQLCNGVNISIEGKPYRTLPAKAKKIEPPEILPERIPPVRYRKLIPTSFIELKLHEGKNRQVRRMTAAVGFPTLRLVRYAIEKINLTFLSDSIVKPGTVKQLNGREIYSLLKVSMK